MKTPKKTMTSRERVMTALEHREPDRVPMSMSITIDAYTNLKRYMGIEVEEKLKPGRWTEVPIHPQVAQKFGLDVIWLPMGKTHKKPRQSTDPNKWFDGWGIEWTKIPLPGGGYYNEMTGPPLKDATIADLEDYPWPDPYDPGLVEGLRENFRHIHEDTEFAIMTKFGGAIFEQAWYLRGMEQFLMDLIKNQAFVTTLFEKIFKVQKGLDEAGLEAAGEYVDILRLSGEDLGTQEAPLISLQLFRRLVRPFWKNYGDLLNKSCTKKIPAPRSCSTPAVRCTPSLPTGSIWASICWIRFNRGPVAWIPSN